MFIIVQQTSHRLLIDGGEMVTDSVGANNVMSLRCSLPSSSAMTPPPRKASHSTKSLNDSLFLSLPGSWTSTPHRRGIGEGNLSRKIVDGVIIHAAIETPARSMSERCVAIRSVS